MNTIKFMGKNQAILSAKHGYKWFQSYDKIIAGKTVLGQITLDCYCWDFSPTTAKYRNIFTGFTTKETKIKIKSGEIKLKDLNK